MLKSSDRKTFRYITGDFTFDDFRAHWRDRLYLERNLTRVLQHHQHRLSTQAAPPKFGEEASATSAGAAGSAGQVSQRGHFNDGNSAIPAVNSPEARGSRSFTTRTTQRPIMASRLASLGQQGENGEKRTRSLRNLRDRNSTTNANSELVIDLSNIRKKLNFKTNVLDEGERSSKRQKRDAVKCKCHLTIWDNRTDAPSTTPRAFTRDCQVTATETASDGIFVDVELDSPFVIKNEDLMMTYNTKDGLITGLVDRYFMEIKIIPCRANTRWPPMPILGKSDGDHFAHDIRDDSGELQGAVVARYMHLPQAPDADVPLSVFFLHGGRTYRTKYGLSVVSKWMAAGSNSQPTNGLDLDSFREPEKDATNVMSNARGEPRQSLNVNVTTSKNTIKKSTASTTPIIPEVHYRFIATSSNPSNEAEILRRSIAKGYLCPICTMWKSAKLANLEFHLATTHAKYKWTVHSPRQDPAKRAAKPIIIECRSISPARKDEQKDSIFTFEWHAPHKPFDLPAYLGGDEKWLITEKKPLPAPRKSADQKKQVAALLPASQVPDFRTPQRKKYAAVKLYASPEQDQPVYTSVSHRPVSPSEEPRSETDDEIDNEWQIQQHLERLDIVAKREGWSIHERELRKRWDKHRMEEQLEHSRYLSNSLVRFVRKNRKWLIHGKDDLLEIFFDFLQRLKERRVIDDDVIIDVNEMIFNSPTSRPSTANNTFLTNGFKSPVLRNGFSSPVLTNGFSSPSLTDEHDRELERALRPNTLLTPQKSTASTMTNGTHEFSPKASTRLAKDACGICRRPIKQAIRNATFCTDTRCESARTMYHRKCVKKGSTNGISNGKGKAIDFNNWTCMVCIKRRGEKHAKAQERHEEKEVDTSKEKEKEGEKVNGLPPEHGKSPRRPIGRTFEEFKRTSEVRFSHLL
jgi:hypothetical protein